MNEVLIAVALIGVAAILAGVLFGDNIRSQFGKTGRAVGGYSTGDVGETEDWAKVAAHRDLSDFADGIMEGEEPSLETGGDFQGHYTGNFGNTDMQASFSQDGDTISGWMIFTHNDLGGMTVKRYFSGKVQDGAAKLEETGCEIIKSYPWASPYAIDLELPANGDGSIGGSFAPRWDRGRPYRFSSPISFTRS
jgi:hypothetical protein